MANFTLSNFVATKISTKLANRLIGAANNYADGVGDTVLRTSQNYTDAAFSQASKAGNGIFGGKKIGQPGKLGFGQGICELSSAQLSEYGMTPMTGFDDETSENFGRYQHTSGSIFVWLPRIYVRIGNKQCSLYPIYGANTIEVADASVFPTEAEANEEGFALLRSDIDGGVTQSGQFLSPYLASKNDAGNGIVCQANRDPLVLYTSSSQMTKGITVTPYGRSRFTGVGQYLDAIPLCQSLGKGASCMNIFLASKVSLLTLAHAQTASSSEACAWFDANGITNFPKGNNNSSSSNGKTGSCVDDTSITFTGATTYGSRTGTASPIAKTTHNGQACGITDINGPLWNVAIGVTTPGGTNGGTTLYVLKTSVKFEDLIETINEANSAFGSAASYLTSKYDALASLTSKYTVGGEARWGSASYASISSDAKSGFDRDLIGVFPLINGTGGTNLFGGDGMWGYHNGSAYTNSLREYLFPVVFGSWRDAARSGVFARSVSTSRTNSDYGAGFRPAIYVGR